MSIKGARSARRRAGARGVTLVELIMFIVIISVALAGILQVMRLTTANSADPLRRKQALMIAEALLEEVRQADMTYCDPRSDNADSATSTAACTIKENFGNEGPAGTVFLRPFDNVNDYVTAANTAQAAFNDGSARLTDALGRPLDVTGYSATVSIAPDSLGDIAAGSGADSEALRIRVVVSYAGDKPVTLDGYRARYAPMPRPE
jgi:MSHA pilin protein MshD